MKANNNCDCGWPLPHHFKVNLGLKSEDFLPAKAVISLSCPLCGKAWFIEMNLKFSERTVTE